MDKKVFKWRKNNPKCKFCKYCEWRDGRYIVPDYYVCTAKDKIVNDEIPRIFCRCYEVNENE